MFGGGRGGTIRLLVGLAISAFFVAATLSRVDIAQMGAALRSVDLRAVVIAIPLVGLELILRSIRWQRLLAPIVVVPLRLSAAYLSIGYFANTMLPARLGDVARAYLAGQSLGVSRLAVLGTIVVERLADGIFILGVVAVLGLTVAGGASLASTALTLVLLAGLAGVAVVVAIAYIRSSGGGAIRTRLRSLLDRVLLGAAALRSPAGFALVALLTAGAFAVAVAMFAVIARAAGVELSIAQCALAMGAVALSTSIPAAPGSIGTYEFVGLTILTALGIDPEVALSIVLLVHLAATLPLALAGLVAAWQLHFRVSEIATDAEPSRLGTEDPPTALPATDG